MNDAALASILERLDAIESRLDRIEVERPTRK